MSPEGTLIARAGNGDGDAYATLLQQHAGIAPVALSITRSEADAEEATQEAFLKAFHALPRFRAGRRFRPWLLRIVANEAHNVVRSSARQARINRVAAEQPPASVPPADEELLAAEQRQARNRRARAASPRRPGRDSRPLRRRARSRRDGDAARRSSVHRAGARVPGAQAAAAGARDRRRGCPRGRHSRSPSRRPRARPRARCSSAFRADDRPRRPAARVRAGRRGPVRGRARPARLRPHGDRLPPIRARPAR